MDSAWSLIIGDFTLIDVERTDEILPDERFKSTKDLQRYNVGVKVNSAGNFYLTWLIYDVSYLSCVLQDTTMEYTLAKELGRPMESLSMAFKQTEKFLDFMEEKELEERASWGIGKIIPCVVPELKRRLDLQKTALLSNESSR